MGILSTKIGAGRMVVVVVEDHPRLDERVVGQVPAGDVGIEIRHRPEVGLEVREQRRRVDQRRERHELGLVVVDAPRASGVGQAIEDRRREVGFDPLLIRHVEDVARRGRRVEERAVADRLRRHRAEPGVVNGERLRQRRQHRQLLRREGIHDDAVLVERRNAFLQLNERVAVIPNEALHRRRRARRGRVVGRLHFRRRLELVRGRIDEAEELGVDARVRFARIRVRVLHIGVGPRARARGDRRVTVVDERGHGIGEGAVGEPVEALAGGVDVAQQVVERAVLEHHHHQVIEARHRVFGPGQLDTRVAVARPETRRQQRRAGGGGRRFQELAPRHAAGRSRGRLLAVAVIVMPVHRSFSLAESIQSVPCRMISYNPAARTNVCDDATSASQPRIVNDRALDSTPRTYDRFACLRSGSTR